MSRDNEELDRLDNMLIDDQHTTLTPEQQIAYDQLADFMAECEKANRDCYPEE